MSPPMEQVRNQDGVSIPMIRADGTLVLPKNWLELDTADRQEMVLKLDYSKRIVLCKTSPADQELVEGTPLNLHRVTIKKIDQPFIDLHQVTVEEMKNGTPRVTYQWTYALEKVITDFLNIFKHPLSVVGETYFETDDDSLRKLAAVLEQKPDIVIRTVLFKFPRLRFISWEGLHGILKRVDSSILRGISIINLRGPLPELDQLIASTQWKEARELNWLNHITKIPLASLSHFNKLKINKIEMTIESIRELIINFSNTPRPLGSFFDVGVMECHSGLNISSKQNMGQFKILTALKWWPTVRFMTTHGRYTDERFIPVRAAASEVPCAPRVLMIKTKYDNRIKRSHVIGVICRKLFMEDDFTDALSEFEERVNPTPISVRLEPPSAMKHTPAGEHRPDRNVTESLQVSINENVEYIAPLPVVNGDSEDFEEKPILTEEELKNLLLL